MRNADSRDLYAMNIIKIIFKYLIKWYNFIVLTHLFVSDGFDGKDYFDSMIHTGPLRGGEVGVFPQGPD